MIIDNTKKGNELRLEYKKIFKEILLKINAITNLEHKLIINIEDRDSLVIKLEGDQNKEVCVYYIRSDGTLTLYNDFDFSYGVPFILYIYPLNSDWYTCKIKLTQTPHCCGTALLHDALVYCSVRNKGIGRALFHFSMCFAYLLGFSNLTAYVVNNSFSNKILSKLGFKLTDSFFNTRSDNIVNAYSYNLCVFKNNDVEKFS